MDIIKRDGVMNIKIQVWKDLSYVRIIGVWYSEEESDFIAPENDTRSIQEKNIPHIAVLSAYEAQKIADANFLEKNIDTVKMMFIKKQGIFQPASKVEAETFLAKMCVGYKLEQEIKLNLSDNISSIEGEKLAKMVDIKTLALVAEKQKLDRAIELGLEKFIYTADGSKQYLTVTYLS